MAEIDLYVDDIAEETGMLFGDWSDSYVDMSIAVPMYMKSDLRCKIDAREPLAANLSSIKQARLFTNLAKVKIRRDGFLCEWLGHFYTYMQQVTGIPSAKLIDIMPFDLMYHISNTLHDLAMPLAIERMRKRFNV